MSLARSLSLLISLPLLLGLGCKERDRSTDLPAAEGPYGTAAPPPGSTRPNSTTRPAESGRAVAPQSNTPGGGPVIVDGPGPGSPGTR